MKKLLPALLCALMLLALAACGGGGDAQTADVDVSALADEMLAALDPQGEMVEVTGDIAANYYDMGGLVKEYKIYISSMYIAEEVAVFRLNDVGKTADGEAMIQARIQDLRESFDGYLPEELASLDENALVLAQGDVVCFLTGIDPGRDAARAVFDEAVG